MLWSFLPNCSTQSHRVKVKVTEKQSWRLAPTRKSLRNNFSLRVTRLVSWCGSKAVPMVAPLYVYKVQIKNTTSLNHHVRGCTLCTTIIHDSFGGHGSKILLLGNANDCIYYCRGDLL